VGTYLSLFKVNRYHELVMIWAHSYKLLYHILSLVVFNFRKPQIAKLYSIISFPAFYFSWNFLLSIPCGNDPLLGKDESLMLQLWRQFCLFTLYILYDLNYQIWTAGSSNNKLVCHKGLLFRSPFG
jgi:hypothetical protein